MRTMRVESRLGSNRDGDSEKEMCVQGTGEAMYIRKA